MYCRLGITQLRPSKKILQSASADSEEWNDLLKQPKLGPQLAKSSSPLEIIQHAMTEFESSGERPSTLQKVRIKGENHKMLCLMQKNIPQRYSKNIFLQVYIALSSVPPTSCEAERQGI